ncbi:hypothetical protein BN903_232 [Halorubrum sp. AJ67]|nr:hypothetical protein BN903_232 [Halorubrum sp. AJ67]
MTVGFLGLQSLSTFIFRITEVYLDITVGWNEHTLSIEWYCSDRDFVELSAVDSATLSIAQYR